MRRTEHLIRQIRRQTDNEAVGSDNGINTEEILQYLNDAQEDLQQALMDLNLGIFVETEKKDIVANQEEYDPPDNTFGSHGIVRVDYAYNGQNDDYRPLKHNIIPEERTYTGTAPWQWIMRANKLLINPVPAFAQTNGLRIWYRKKLESLDIRRSQIDAVTVAAGEITALTLDPSLFDSTYDEWLEDDYLTIISSSGVIKTYGVHYSSIDIGSGAVTLDGNHVLRTGDITPAVDDWVCRGFRATDVSSLADFCEKYLLQYGAFRILCRDESDSATREAAIMAQMKEDIRNTYRELQGDIDYIPAIDYDFAEYL